MRNRPYRAFLYASFALVAYPHFSPSQEPSSSATIIQYLQSPVDIQPQGVRRREAGDMDRQEDFGQTVTVKGV